MESKIEATERLRRQGHWDEAKAFREQERRRLRAEGVPKREAVKQAWDATIAEFCMSADDFEILREIIARPANLLVRTCPPSYKNEPKDDSDYVHWLWHRLWSSTIDAATAANELSRELDPNARDPRFVPRFFGRCARVGMAQTVRLSYEKILQERLNDEGEAAIDDDSDKTAQLLSLINNRATIDPTPNAVRITVGPSADSPQNLSPAPTPRPI
jgi:hypothetical protein